MVRSLASLSTLASSWRLEMASSSICRSEFKVGVIRWKRQDIVQLRVVYQQRGKSRVGSGRRKVLDTTNERGRSIVSGHRVVVNLWRRGNKRGNKAEVEDFLELSQSKSGPTIRSVR